MWFGPVKYQSGEYMDMFDESRVLCASSAYEKKYYLNQAFEKLPESIRDELKIMCVLFTEDVGGVLTMEYDEDGSLFFRTEADEEDLLYDEVGSGLKIKQLQSEKRELLEALELYYKVVILGENIEE